MFLSSNYNVFVTQYQCFYQLNSMLLKNNDNAKQTHLFFISKETSLHIVFHITLGKIYYLFISFSILLFMRLIHHLSMNSKKCRKDVFLP